MYDGYEKVNEVEDWDEEMYREEGKRVVDVEHGGLILLGLVGGAGLIIGLSVIKLLRIANDAYPISNTVTARNALPSPPSPPNIEICIPSPPSYNKICGNPHNFSQTSTLTTAPTSLSSPSRFPSMRQKDIQAQALPVVSLAFYIFSTLWCTLKRALGSYAFRGPTRAVLILSTIIAIVSLVLMTRMTGDGEARWLWNLFKDEVLFLEWLTEAGTVAWNWVGWWYWKKWERENSWEMRDWRKQRRLEVVYAFEGGE